MIAPLLLIAAYILGGIPFGYLLVKMHTGKDVRALGSGNIGATNVLRTSGPLAGIMTLLLDMLKGWFAVWLMARFTNENPLWMSLAAVATPISLHRQQCRRGRYSGSFRPRSCASKAYAQGCGMKETAGQLDTGSSIWKPALRRKSSRLMALWPAGGMVGFATFLPGRMLIWPMR